MIIGPAHPLRGGLASYDERMARQFMQEGDQVILYTFSLQYPSFLFPGTTQYSSAPAPADLDIRVRINSINPVNWIVVGNELAALRPGIIVVRFWLPFMGPALGTILRRVRRNGFTKIICLADNIVPHEKRVGDKSLTRYFLRAVQGCITMSEKVLRDLKTIRPSLPALLVPHPLFDNFGEQVDKTVAREQLGLPAGQKLLVFFGFIRRYKGLDLLLRAMGILKRRKREDIHLMIAGEFYENAEPYHEIIRSEGIEQMLILRTDFVADEDVKYFISAADVIVQPYRSATQSGVTPLAYHFERPMIVTDVGGLAELVPDGKAGLVTTPEPEAIADVIERFYETGESFFIPFLVEEKKKYAWSHLTRAIREMAAAIE